MTLVAFEDSAGEPHISEERLSAIANDREQWWQQMRDCRVQTMETSPPSFTRLPRGHLNRYWQICGFPGDPDYLLSTIHNHKARKVCYLHVMAGLRRLLLRYEKSS